MYQHEPVWFDAGGTKQQAAALRVLAALDSPPTPTAGGDEAQKASTLFSALELEVLQLAYHMSRTVRVPQPLLRSLHAQLGDTQLVEFVGTIAAYNGVSRVLVALDITPEGEDPPARAG